MEENRDFHIHKLSQKCESKSQKILVLYTQARLTHFEIARMLNITTHHVRQALYRWRKRAERQRLDISIPKETNVDIPALLK